MTDYEAWALHYPQAAADLQRLFGALPWPVPEEAEGKSEAWAQQQARLSVAQRGALSFRNNVGATPAKCPECNAKQRPVRYGLANDSARLNKEIKSGDLILAIPRQITAPMVGSCILQFGTAECKRPGWTYTGKDQEPGQLAWNSLIARHGGYATFTTGAVTL